MEFPSTFFFSRFDAFFRRLVSLSQPGLQVANRRFGPLVGLLYGHRIASHRARLNTPENARNLRTKFGNFKIQLRNF